MVNFFYRYLHQYSSNEEKTQFFEQFFFVLQSYQILRTHLYFKGQTNIEMLIKIS